MKDGAADYLTKPLNLEQVRLIIGKALDRQSLWRELRHHREQQARRLAGEMIRGESPEIKEVFSIAERVARSDLTSVLIDGESGTGKQFIARLIHDLSRRRDGPFVELSCAAIPRELIESELFGHERGAFTDAKAQKQGLMELADGGTLFLDEIGEMPLTLQAKLLKVLEGMTFRRVGGVKDISVSVRIISATNRNLRLLCETAAFREDLYYRLKVVPITMPPLRSRNRDVLLFAKHFLHQFSKQFGKRFRGIAPDAETWLLTYPWPGNIRELRNVFERTVLLEDGELLEPRHLRMLERPGGAAGDLCSRLASVFRDGRIPEEGIPFEALVAEVERGLIVAACERSGWNQSRAAQLLMLGRDKLRYRMKLHGVSREQKAA
jgi:DNA-binding NtrC family response regulator